MLLKLVNELPEYKQTWHNFDNALIINLLRNFNGNYSTGKALVYGNYSIFFSRKTVSSATSFSRCEKSWLAP